MKIIGSVKEDLNIEKRISITPETVKKFVDLNFSVFIEKNYAGNVLLFHVLRQSTIGAEGLDFRVRNGIGYDPFAIITRHIGYIFIKLFCK